MPDQLPRSFGRQAFGADPASYDAARPPYPEWVFEELEARGLGPGAAVFEIGAGTGTATRRLLAAGANPLVAIEPDLRLAGYLKTHAAGPGLRVLTETFEAAELPPGVFDFGIAATSFHWLDESRALAKIARLLRPGGWWAPVWNEFGDRRLPDPFHDATHALLSGQRESPSGSGGPPFGSDVDARLAALRRAGFTNVEPRLGYWPLVLGPDETVRLYATYSNITARPDRDDVLAELRRIAQAPPFSGRVVRNMTTAMYLARRP